MRQDVSRPAGAPEFLRSTVCAATAQRSARDYFAGIDPEIEVRDRRNTTIALDRFSSSSIGRGLRSLYLCSILSYTVQQYAT
jgi:hypothetical protein